MQLAAKTASNISCFRSIIAITVDRRMIHLNQYILLALILVGLVKLSAQNEAIEECERLQASLTYTQEEAPRDLSGLVRSIQIFKDAKKCSTFAAL